MCICNKFNYQDVLNHQIPCFFSLKKHILTDSSLIKLDHQCCHNLNKKEFKLIFKNIITGFYYQLIQIIKNEKRLTFLPYFLNYVFSLIEI